MALNLSLPSPFSSSFASGPPTTNGRKRSNYRSVLEIHIAILMNATSPIFTSYLMRQANLNHTQLKFHCGTLVKAGLLLEKDGGAYEVGKEYLTSSRGRVVLGLWRSFDVEYCKALFGLPI
jgi:predicted transcriptional regulator